MHFASFLLEAELPVNTPLILKHANELLLCKLKHYCEAFFLRLLRCLLLSVAIHQKAASLCHFVEFYVRYLDHGMTKKQAVQQSH